MLMLRTLEQINGSVALGVLGEDQVMGLLVLNDERVREAYSTEEIELFRGVAASIGITLQNSQVVRAHEGARSPGGARRDGGRPGARDPQSARRHQGRCAVAAARQRSPPRCAGDPPATASSSASSSRR